jgi:hypothetical protein
VWGGNILRQTKKIFSQDSTGANDDGIIVVVLISIFYFFAAIVGGRTGSR